VLHVVLPAANDVEHLDADRCGLHDRAEYLGRCAINSVLLVSSDARSLVGMSIRFSLRTPSPARQVLAWLSRHCHRGRHMQAVAAGSSRGGPVWPRGSC
jgi:hypothetical protein